MISEVLITVKPENEHNKKLIHKLILQELEKKNLFVGDKKLEYVFVKKSIDARRGQVKFHLKYKVFIDEKMEDLKTSELSEWKTVTGDKSVLIIGAGPAGLFGALKLLEKGIKPIIIERGSETLKRKQDIAKISTQNVVNADSNYCFGEGGAGTFSDGKLYTRSNKRGNINKILQIFVHFGANEAILTDAHPHIGTDKLPGIINAMRKKILELGGEFYFDTRCVDFVKGKDNKVTGIVAKNTINQEEKTFTADGVVVATGHSAFDIYELIAKTNPQALEAKTFAMGVRVEHPRVLIDTIQYHGKNAEGTLPTAEYRLTTQVDERGVYSFCMCPGGFVVPSATGPDEIVVNGMSSAARNSKWSNAAIVVETRPEDVPLEFVEKAKQAGTESLAGLYFRKYIEEETKKQGNGQAAPAQILTDFIANQDSSELPKTSYTPGVVPSRLDKWLPEHISKRLIQGFKNFDKFMKGFVSSKALLIASETRTSTPVRILRNQETYECDFIPGVFPCGEGSGYSGGIVSSAMDGENVCQAISDLI